jgi:hypothetical protein
MSSFLSPSSETKYKNTTKQKKRGKGISYVKNISKVNRGLKYPMKTMSRLDGEIERLNQTIETNKKLAINLAEKRNLLEQISEKGHLGSSSTSPHKNGIKAAENDEYTVREMIEAEAELEEANALLAYRKALRERLRTRITTMKQAADVTWKAYKGRGKSRDLALALAKIAALEREVDDLHDVELTMMQREQLRVRRDARLNAATNIQNKELAIQLNEALDQLESERRQKDTLSQENAKLKLKIDTMESELRLAHKTIIEETTAANIAKTEVSQLTRRLRISEAELIASHSRVAEKQAIAEHFKESLNITNQALDQELLANERLHAVKLSPTVSRFRESHSTNINDTTSATNYLSSRNRILEEVLQEERVNITRDIERARDLQRVRAFGERNSPEKSLSPKGAGLNSSLLDKGTIRDGLLTLDDASLIRAKARAMAAAAEERLKIEEELYQIRLRSSS